MCSTVTGTSQRHHLWDHWECTTPLWQSSFGEFVVPLFPHPIPARASWQVGNGKICLWEGRSAPLSPATPCPTQLPPQEWLSGRGERVGDVFLDVWLCYAWSSTGIESGSLHPFLKCNWKQGPALCILECQEAFLFYFCFSFFPLSRESRQNQKEAPVLIKTDKVLHILVEFYTQLGWGWVTAEHRALSQDQDITTLETVMSMRVREFLEWTKVGASVEK